MGEGADRRIGWGIILAGLIILAVGSAQLSCDGTVAGLAVMGGLAIILGGIVVTCCVAPRPPLWWLWITCAAFGFAASIVLFLAIGFGTCAG